MKTKSKLLVLAASVAGLMAGVSAQAQNTLHAPSDLLLTFQNPGGATGGAQTVSVALGNVSTLFRDATPGSFTLLNTANISGLGSTLTSTFGANWFDASTLWAGAIGFRGTNPTTNALLDLDPHQTLYFSKVRTTIGTVGEANTPTPTTIAGSGDGITSAMGQVKGRIEAAGTTAVFTEGTGTSFIDDQNPFTGGNPAFGQSTAYAFISGGVQGQFGLGDLGTYGAAGQVEMALDLYRLQNRDNVPGQYGFGEPVREGDYLGTLTINQAGDVGFLAASAVPEPTSMALLGLTALGFAARRRRPVANA